MEAFFFCDIDENDILTNLTDTFPGDDEFAFSCEQAAEFSWTWNDKRGETSGFAVEFHINRTAHTFAGAGIDDFFLFQFTNTHKNLLFFLTFDLQLYYDEIRVVIP